MLFFGFKRGNRIKKILSQRQNKPTQKNCFPEKRKEVLEKKTATAEKTDLIGNRRKCSNWFLRPK